MLHRETRAAAEVQHIVEVVPMPRHQVLELLRDAIAQDVDELLIEPRGKLIEIAFQIVDGRTVVRRAAERIEEVALNRISRVVGEPQSADLDGCRTVTTGTEERERGIEDRGALFGIGSGEAGIGRERLLDPTGQHRREGPGAGELAVSIGVQRR